jgi:hypothetical protein
MSVASRQTETPAADAAKLLIRLGLAILMVALPCAGVALRGAIYVLMPIGAVLILLGALVGEPEHGPRHLRTALLSPAGMTALFLTFWAGLSLLWTPFLAQAGQRFAQIVGTTFLVALVAAYLPTRTKAFDLYLQPVGAALSAIAMLALAWRGPDWFLGASEFDESLFQRSMITLIVLVWPALGALALREHWILAAGLALLAAAVALAGFAQIGLAAMGAAAFTFALAMPQAGRLARRLGFFFAGLVLLAPALPLIYGAILSLTRHEAGPASQSMLIWRDLVISEWPRLITGHGFDTADRGVNLGYLPELTPRSLLFVIWYDLGVIGAAAFAFLTVRLFLLASRIPAAVAPAALAGIVAILTLSIFGVATAQIWWVTLIDCAVIAFVVLIKGIYRTQRPAAPPIGEALDIADEEAGASPPPGGAGAAF